MPTPKERAESVVQAFIARGAWGDPTRDVLALRRIVTEALTSAMADAWDEGAEHAFESLPETVDFFDDPVYRRNPYRSKP